MWLTAIIAGAFFWAFSNSFDSIIANRYEKDPMTIMWYMAIVSFIPTALLALYIEISLMGLFVISCATALSYIGDNRFYALIQKVDISLTNAAWAILTIYLTIAGFVFFGDTWTLVQAAGALLAFAGIWLLTFLPAASSSKHMLLKFALLALPYIPFWIVQKYYLLQGAAVLDITIISSLSWSCMAFIVPLFIKKKRSLIQKRYQKLSFGFFFCQVILIATWFIAQYLTALAYARGPLSLVSIAANIQPFFAIIIAACIAKLVPKHAPRELLTAYSLKVKVISFSVMFVGLGLLSLS